MAKDRSNASVCQVQAQQAPVYPFNGKKFLRVSQAAHYLGVSENQVRLLCDAGELPLHLTCGNHRRIDARKLFEFAHGLTPEEASSPVESKCGRLIGLARVSGRKQATPNGENKSSLEHQEERIRAYSREKYNANLDECILSVGSGLNFERKEFLELIERIITNQLRGATIIVTCPDRVCRFGRKLIEFLCNVGGVTLDYMSEDEEKGENEKLLEDVLSIMTVFTAKCSGRKAGNILRVVMTPEHLTLAYKMKCKGISYQGIADHFKMKNLRSDKGKTYSPQVIRKHLVSNWAILEMQG